jgi:urease subunit gamma/beta
MNLTPTENDRLLLHLAAQLARSRRARGLRLNVPETIALVADSVAEAGRDGLRVTEAVRLGQELLGPDDVLPGVADIVTEVQVEAVFSDGSRLVTVPDPIGGGHLGAAAPGAILTEGSPAPVHEDDLVVVEVTNEATVPISVTSHFHFFEVNPRLRFDRRAAYGRHLAIPAGAVVRFGPGEPLEVALAPFGGARVVVGFAGLVDGPLDAPGAIDEALRRARACGFLDSAPGATLEADPDGAVARATADRADRRS